ncbi:PQQ-dependent sugar dehydrogenase [Candidatus Pelagibacter ubique]|nr:PQQ-dependent sugar dehydrogenase [Candidatus Pelagibacter ubique]
MKVKLTSIIILFLLTLYFLFSSQIGKKDSFLRPVLNYLPSDLKDSVKYYLFPGEIKKIYDGIIKKEKNTISRLENENHLLKKIVSDRIYEFGYVPFTYLRTDKIQIKNNKLKLNIFSSDNFWIGKGAGAKGSGYLEYHDNKIFFAGANGFFSYFDFAQFSENKFRSNLINSNFMDFVNKDTFEIPSNDGIKDLFIHNNQIFVSYTNEVLKNGEKCFNTAIVSANLNINYLDFNSFFMPKDCATLSGGFGFSTHHSGGRMVLLDDDHLLFTIGEYRKRSKAQDISSELGKLLKINISDKNYEIISLGSRNQQGLTLNKKTNTIFMTEHGPNGGDEINIFQINDIPTNLGWPISSYGEHYKGITDLYPNVYDFHPLHKSHSDYGFHEPFQYFTPGIGISEIIFFDKYSFFDNENYKLLMGSMGGDTKEGDLSLHYFELNNNYSKLYHEVLPIDERVRDMIYIKDKNIIVLFLENTASIAILELN